MFNRLCRRVGQSVFDSMLLRGGIFSDSIYLEHNDKKGSKINLTFFEFFQIHGRTIGHDFFCPDIGIFFKFDLKYK